MTEAGGSTTQSGILYQNSVAALYLGRLLDVSNRPDKERVEQVRVEAPTEVDDTVVSFADAHQIYIQSKEYLRNNSDDWKTLWRHFDEQFRSSKFQRGQDRLLLQISFGLEEHHKLAGICESAANSTTSEEWQLRLKQTQKDIINKITPHLSPTGLTIEYSRELLAHVDVKVLSRDDIEQDRLQDWIPHTNRTQKELFRLLRDRIGGEARVKGVFTAHSLRKDLLAESPDLHFDVPVDIDTIRDAIRQCGSLLRQHQNTITGTDIHIKREVVDKVVEWLLNQTATDKNVSMLLDEAGIGKTVVMRDVLSMLEHHEVDVLAIKADQQLSDIKVLGDFQGKLGLPYPVEKIVSRLAQLNRVVVLIDQIDALSLSLAHDQQSINITLDLIARLRRIPNVRILLSCRVFDQRTDPRLNTFETGQTFTITKLSETQVKDVLSVLHVNYDQLTLATKDLLNIPLHLDLFARAVATNDVDFAQLHGIGSLQELYALIWQHVVLKPEINSPPISERVEVINILTEYMDIHQRTAAPQALLQTVDTQHLERAVNWLASTGILIRGKTEWNFLHQTFFDYSYARQFVERGNNILTTVLNSKQGIFERPKLIQITAYLRSFDHSRYINNLHSLFEATGLRFHLYDLFLRWFGALSNPTVDEWQIAKTQLRNDLRFSSLLPTMYGNTGWFKYLQPSIHRWLADEARSVATLSYLGSLIDIAQAEVIALIEPYCGKSDEWNNRIAGILFYIRDWHTESAVSLYERIIYKLNSPNRRYLLSLDDVCDISPVTGCRIIRYLCDQALESQLDKITDQGKEQPVSQSYPSFFLDTEFRELEGIIEKAMGSASAKAPIQYVEAMLPWIEKVISVEPRNDNKYWFKSDALSYNWYEDTFRIQNAFVHNFINALTQVARDKPEIFRPIAQLLADLPYQTPQQFLTYVYRALPDIYAEDAINFLMGDQRRLDIGENEQYDSRQVISAIFPHLSGDQRMQLEEKILQYFWPINKDIGLRALRWRGHEQYKLLHAIPYHLLSREGQRRLGEWQRKFPDITISDKPITMEGGIVPSPIPSELAAKMSNRSWLRAMGKYQHGVERNGILGGGARQLSSVFSEQIKNNPERFHKLFEEIPQDIDDAYVIAFANGFIDSNSPAEWVFDVFRRYASQEGRKVQRELSYSIQKVAKHDIPEDILKKLIEWVYKPEDEAESWWAKGDTHGSIYDSYINSERGSAFAALMRIFDAKFPEQAHEQKWELIEYACSDSSLALRLGAIQELTYMIKYDRGRSWLLFEKLVTGYEVLVETHQVREYLHWSMYKNFIRLKPFIEQMITNPKLDVQEMGAELACIAAISEKAMESDEALTAAKALANDMITGQPSLRRGATNVYTFNMTQGTEQNVRAQCLDNIRKLINDNDKEICDKINQKFFSLSDEFFFDFRGLMEDIAQSKYHPLNFQFANYLWKYGMLDPKWTLSIIRILITKTIQPQQWDSGAEELLRFVLLVYTSQADDVIREDSINVFDVLMKRYVGTANKILSEWDRR